MVAIAEFKSKFWYTFNMFKKNSIAFFICFLFFCLYTILGIIRHNHFLSGYDLAVIDQAIWKYSIFTAPISTNHAYAFTSILTDHVELIFLLLAPFYWIINDVRMLIVLQALVISFSGLAVFLFSREKKLKKIISYALLVSYLMFYGVQNAVWSDVHSLVFGVSFLAWFWYFLEVKRYRYAWIFFFLAIFSKEDIALLTLLMSGVYFIKDRNKHILGFLLVSIVYLISIFFIYFPFFVPGGYRFQSRNGLLSHLDVQNFYNTDSRRNVLLYSSLWYGLLPFLSPLFLLPAVGDLAHYFVLGNAVVTSAQSIFMHYRVSLALLLVWPTIMTITKFKKGKLNNKYMALYLLLWAFILQYHLHLPLSYFTKTWFLTRPNSVLSIEEGLASIPPDASIVTQVNILPHASHRKLEFLMWPMTKDFKKNSPCGKKSCQWFRWPGDPEYIIVNTSEDWDERYWLTTRATFKEGLANLEKEGVIKKYKQIDETTIYKVIKRP